MSMTKEESKKPKITDFFKEIVEISRKNLEVSQHKEIVLSLQDHKLLIYDENSKMTFDIGDYSISLRFLRKIEKLQSLTYTQRCMKADCLIRLGCLEKAQVLIDEALKEDPLDLAMIYIQSLKYYYDLELEKCIACSEQAVTLDQNYLVAKNIRRLAIYVLQILRIGKTFFSLLL
jgi:tetratricopeptide (TPR) repeat protein